MGASRNPADGGTIKDPNEWTTGDEPMTGAQASYLKTLSDQASEPFDENLTKAEASRRIDELQAMTGRHPPNQKPEREGNQAQGAGARSDAGKQARTGQ